MELLLQLQPKSIVYLEQLFVFVDTRSLSQHLVSFLKVYQGDLCARPYKREAFRYVKTYTSSFVDLIKRFINSCVIDNIWLIYEYLGLNPDLLWKIKSFSMKYSNILLYISCSNIFPQIGSNVIGR